MDAENLILQLAGFTLEVCVTCLLYKIYRSEANCLKSLKEAPCLELDSNLKKTVEDSNGVLQYVAISGKIQALTAPLRSQFVPHLRGVIRETITVEKKAKWNIVLGLWGSSNNNILETVNSVPFALCSSKPLNIFKKRISVEITKPLTAEELVIPKVYDKFRSCFEVMKPLLAIIRGEKTLESQETEELFCDIVFDIILNERTLRIRDIEKLLCEDETLLAIGKLVIENDKLKIKPPDGGLTYFLTPLSLETLISKANFSTKVFKVATFIFGMISLFSFIYLSRRAFSEIKRRISHRREKKKYEEERRKHRMADKFRNANVEEVNKCIVCLDNHIELMLLECGHLCLCYDCYEYIHNQCPVCRNPIARTVSAFWA